MSDNDPLPSLQYRYRHEVSDLYLVVSSKGLRHARWKPLPEIEWVRSLTGADPLIRILKKVVKQLDQFFAGQRSSFDIPLDPLGTPFQKQVWEALARIPYGTTLSYQGLARKLNNEKAMRAVGSANAKNPLCIVVPCHRVIASNGSLGGYSGGLTLKKRLLHFESGGGNQS